MHSRTFAVHPNWPLLEMVTKYDLLWRDFAFYCTLFMNVTMLLSYSMVKTECEIWDEEAEEMGEGFCYGDRFNNGILYGIFYGYALDDKTQEENLKS